MKLKYIFLLVFFILYGKIQAKQTPEIDSLKNTLQNSSDTNRVKILNRLCWKLRYINFDEALKYGNEAINLAQKLNFQYGICEAYSFTGVVYRNQGDYMKAGEHFYKALRIAEKENFKKEIAYSYNNIGDILKSQGQNQQALEFSKKAVALFEQIQDDKGLGYAYIRIGEIYQGLQEYDKALEIFFKCLKIREDANDIDGIESVSNRIGKSYEKLKNYEKALIYFNKSLEITRKTNDLRSEYEALEDISRVYMATNKPLEALDYTLRSLQIAEELGAKDGIKRCSESLANIYAQKKDFERAYFYQQKYLQIQHQLVNEENSQYLATIHNNYELQKKQDEIRLLNKDRQIKQLIVNILIVGIVFLIVIIIFSIKISQQRKRLNKALSDKNAEIEQQSENLMLANQQVEQKNQALEQTLLQVKSMQTQLVQSEKMASLGQLVAGVAHEINNPINFVSAGADALQITLDDLAVVIEKYELYDKVSTENLVELQEKIKKIRKKYDFDSLKDDAFMVLSDIKSGANRTTEIVKGLRTFSRLDENDLKSADLHENLDSTLIILKNQIKNRIEVVKDFAQELPLIDCFPGQLNQVFMNILVNAIQAIENEGKITIKTWTQDADNQVFITISDTGSGMPDHVKARIFEPFYTTKDVGKGTGLGLSISHGIIEKHKGTISVESEIGKGTRFLITLPIHQKH